MPKDSQLVGTSKDQRHEIYHISQYYDIPLMDVRAAVLALKAAGKVYRTRKPIYQVLNQMGYDTSKKAVKKPLEKCNLLPDPNKKLPLERPKWKPKPVPQPTPTPVPTPTPTPTPQPVPLPTDPTQVVECIFFNFNGGTIKHIGWNGGVQFTVAASLLTAEQRAQALVKAQTAYSQFNVAVTDDINVYNAAAKRQQIYVTNTSSWYPQGVSGIAKIGSLFGAAEAPAFVFSDRLFNSAAYVGAIMVHEAGHTVGLRHQGEYGQACSLIQTYKPGAEMGNALYVPQGEWIYQQCSGQDDIKLLTQLLGLK